ncbi:MAG: DUF692 domain-containing protein [Oligoflexus sp.]
MHAFPQQWHNLGYGLGLRATHYDDILQHQPAIDWFEALSENYLATEGRPRRKLLEISERYPIVLHGVSMSVGGSDPLNKDYLQRLKNLAKEVSAVWISDHLCWTGSNGINVHDLLPLPYHEESLKHVVQRVREVQDFLEQPILIENPSSYLAYSSSNISEWDFLKALSEEADCGLLLDINNIYVSAKNHGFDPFTYIDAIPPHKVGQYHLAGHTVKQKFILDSHIGPVPQGVWDLYRYTLKKIGQRSCMIEWDENIPELSVLIEEAERMKSYGQPSLTLRKSERRDGVEL